MFVLSVCVGVGVRVDDGDGVGCMTGTIVDDVVVVVVGCDVMDGDDVSVCCCFWL